MNNLLYPIYGGQIIAKSSNNILLDSKQNELILYTVNSNLRMLFGITSNYPTMIMDADSMIIPHISLSNIYNKDNQPIYINNNLISTCNITQNIQANTINTQRLITKFLDTQGELSLKDELNILSNNIKINNNLILTSNSLFTSNIYTNNNILNINDIVKIIIVNDSNLTLEYNNSNVFTYNSNITEFFSKYILTNQFIAQHANIPNIQTSNINNNLIFTQSNTNIKTPLTTLSNIHAIDMTLQNITQSTSIKTDTITTQTIYTSNTNTSNINNTIHINSNNVEITKPLDILNINSLANINNDTIIINSNDIALNTKINIYDSLYTQSNITVNNNLTVNNKLTVDKAAISNINDKVYFDNSNVTFSNIGVVFQKINNNSIVFESNSIIFNEDVNFRAQLDLENINSSNIITTNLNVENFTSTKTLTSNINDTIIFDNSNTIQIQTPVQLASNLTVPYIETSNINNAIFITGNDVKFASDLTLRFSTMETSNINNVIFFSIDNSNVDVQTNMHFGECNTLTGNKFTISNLHTEKINENVYIYPEYITTSIPIVTTRYVYAQDLYTSNINDNAYFGHCNIEFKVPITAAQFNVQSISSETQIVKNLQGVTSINSNSIIITDSNTNFNNLVFNITYSNDTLFSVNSNGVSASFFRASNIYVPDELTITNLYSIDGFGIKVKDSNIGNWTEKGLEVISVKTSNIDFDNSLNFNINGSNIGTIDSSGMHISMLVDEVKFNTPDLYVNNLKSSNMVQGGMFVIDKVMTSTEAQGGYDSVSQGSNKSIAAWLSPLENLNIINNFTMGAQTINTQYPVYIENENPDNISAYVKGSIVALSTETFSDRRIKKDISTINSQEAYQKVMDIDVSKYTYIENGETRPGFIAQQLENVCPESVKTIKEYIPNIMITSPVRIIDKNIISLTISDHTSKLVSGTKIKMKLNNGKIIYGKIEYYMARKTYDDVIVTCYNHGLSENENIIVIGTMVDDFKIVDYNVIVSYLVSSLQYLSSMILHN